ncbi:M23 family metallopeptidase [Rathayibacter soli]|uniref:M23 family metallopeptidase n=1 Tax=Rathayibacter soli TaxID=3144168 RepID=UPI0027E58BE9|nr:M23 family metallopeptidase [Glaciibacter superstes]
MTHTAVDSVVVGIADQPAARRGSTRRGSARRTGSGRIAGVLLGMTLVALTAACTATPNAGSSAGPSTGPTPSPLVSIPAAYTPVTVQQLGSPTLPFKGSDGRYHVVYDLQLTNASAVPADIQKVDVLDSAHRATPLASFSGKALVDPGCDYGNCNRLRLLPSKPATDTVIPAQQARALLVDFELQSLAGAPKIVVHRLQITGAANPGAKEPTPMTYLAGPINVSAGSARVIAPPVGGTNWVAMNGCCQIGLPHVPSLQPFSGTLANSQRFAIDWVRLDDNGAFYSGDKTKNDSYFSYGQNILAVADGTISSTLDTLAANTPGILPASDPEAAKTLTVENVDGNHIVENLGGGVWAMYAHLQKGSLLVKPGDKVHAGQVIAKLGNTGNSNAAHLHFQLMDGPNLVGSDGVPYVVRNFDYAGFVTAQRMLNSDFYFTGTFFENHLSATQPRSNELPLAGSIVNFTG